MKDNHNKAVKPNIAKKIALLIFAIISLSSLSGRSSEQKTKSDSQKACIFHVPVKTLPYNQFSELECVVEPGLKKTTTVKIFIRNSRERTFKEFPMQYHKGKYFFKIIPEMVQARRLYYFIVAEFSDFSIIAYPSDKPHKKPIRVKLYKKAVKVSKKR